MNNRIKKDKFSQYKPDIFYRDPTRVPTIFSDKDLKVNFKNFPKYKKILVTGQSGSGKTTVSKKLAKKYHCDIVHLDDVYKLGKLQDQSPYIWDYFIHQNKYTLDDMKIKTNKIPMEASHSTYKAVDVFTDLLEYLLDRPEPLIIEGGQLTMIIYSKNFKRILDYPIYLKGTSELKSLIRKNLRNKRLYKNDIRFEDEMITDQNALRKFLLTQSDDIVEVDEQVTYNCGYFKQFTAL